MPAFLSLKKICSKNTEEMFSSSARLFIDTGFPFFPNFARAIEARSA
jgi:hypothetical protein